MSQNYQYNTIEEALRDLKEGKIVLVTDDPDRENEGDLICAAEFATRENINFMATYAKGLICTPMSAEIAVRLNFPPMVAENTDNHSTAFTVAVDHADTTTGISKVSGSGTLFSFIIPNVNDYFTSDAGQARTGLFKITNVDRKTFNSESVYDVTYELIGYVDTGASASLFNDLSSKVVRHYYFDLNRFKDGLYPLVLDETRRKLIDYNIAYKDMLRYYFAKFFNRNYMTDRKSVV